MKNVHKGALRNLVVIGLSLLVSCGSGATTENEVLITILKVVDGDTVDIEIDGHTERVRLIGVNTPETKHPTKPIECFGPEASAYLTQLLPKGTTVRIERDVEARDRYGRMLLYLYLGSNDLFINLDLVARGYGTPMSIEPNTFHRNDFVRAAAQAEAANVGLWKACR
jgi:micrococcal nuclease